MDEARAERRSPASELTGRKNMLGSPHPPGFTLPAVGVCQDRRQSPARGQAEAPCLAALTTEYGNRAYLLDSGSGPSVSLFRFGCRRMRATPWPQKVLLARLSPRFYDAHPGRSWSVFGSDPESSK